MDTLEWSINAGVDKQIRYKSRESFGNDPVSFPIRRSKMVEHDLHDFNIAKYKFETGDFSTKFH